MLSRLCVSYPRHLCPDNPTASPSSSSPCAHLPTPSTQPSAGTLRAALTATHTGQFPRVFKPPEHFRATSHHRRKEVTVGCQWQVSYQATEPVHDRRAPRTVTARCTHGPQQVASSKPHLSKATRSYMAKIQQCSIHGKLQLRNRLLWCQNVVLIQVFKKSFFLFSDMFFKICRGSQAMASVGGLPPVTNIVTTWKKQQNF